MPNIIFVTSQMLGCKKAPQGKGAGGSGASLASLVGHFKGDAGLLAFPNQVGLAGNSEAHIYVNGSVCLPSTFYSGASCVCLKYPVVPKPGREA